MNTDEQELRSLLAAKSLDITNLRAALQSANERIDKLTEYVVHGSECNWWVCLGCSWRVEGQRRKHAKIGYGLHDIRRAPCTCGLSDILNEDFAARMESR